MLDLTGQRFERWIVIQDPGVGVSVLCRCNCGTERRVCRHSLLKGVSRSCGCLFHENKRFYTRTHGLTNSPEYAIHRAMRQRCENKRDPQYDLYGGRGIRVAPEWRTFEGFYRDMGPRPSPRHSLERIDNSRGYGPDNCRWATMQAQQNNRSTNHLIEYQGRVQTMAQWGRELGIPGQRICARLECGWTEEMALSTPIRTAKTYTFQGETHTLAEWADKVGMHPIALKYRLYRGWTMERALTQRPRKRPHHLPTKRD